MVLALPTNGRSLQLPINVFQLHCFRLRLLPLYWPRRRSFDCFAMFCSRSAASRSFRPICFGCVFCYLDSFHCTACVGSPLISPRPFRTQADATCLTIGADRFGSPTEGLLSFFRLMCCGCVISVPDNFRCTSCVANVLIAWLRNVSQSICGESSHCWERIGANDLAFENGRSLQLPIDVFRLHCLRFQWLPLHWFRRRLSIAPQCFAVNPQLIAASDQCVLAVFSVCPMASIALPASAVR